MLVSPTRFAVKVLSLTLMVTADESRRMEDGGISVVQTADVKLSFDCKEQMLNRVTCLQTAAVSSSSLHVDQLRSAAAVTDSPTLMFAEISPVMLKRERYRC